jgi:antitoxin (DNA-binding transcriptional repressor) of toxin-antitoxin stability system
MKTIPAGACKVNCLALMDEVKARRETILITKRGKPVAKLVPVTTDEDEIFGFFRRRGSITGDVVSPVGIGLFANKGKSARWARR